MLPPFLITILACKRNPCCTGSLLTERLTKVVLSPVFGIKHAKCMTICWRAPYLWQYAQQQYVEMQLS